MLRPSLNPLARLKEPIRILLLEDQIADAELIKYALRDSGLDFTLERVDARPNFLQQLGENPHLILSDYGLPSFDGLAALDLAKEKMPDTPFIFVTGTLGEERAIETLKRGAIDYVLKTRLSRLAPAVHRALREADERRERKRAEERLRESHEQLRALSVYLQHVREEERTRIAREIHDELGQALTGLKFEISMLNTANPAKKPRSVNDVVRSASGQIDAIIQSVRRISTELRPGILDDLGLVAAIEWQAIEFQTRTGIPCEVVASIAEPALREEIKTALFRIFQETITNVLRHAEAHQVEVRLTENNGRVQLVVRDDGRGIAPADIFSTRSLGLLGMRERATLLGGEFHIVGAPHQGTAVTVEIPRASQPARGQSHENSHRGRSRRGAPRLEADSSV